MNKNSYTSLHNHTFFSNTHGIRDAISSPEEALESALEKGLNGIVFTEHESLASTMRVMKHYNKNIDRFKDLKVGFGDEIYLLDKDEMDENIKNNDKVRFSHFIIIAKNRNGYQFLMEQTTSAWEKSFHYKGLMRTPTYYDELKELIKPFKGDVIGTTACEGGIIPQLIISYNKERTVENYNKIIAKLEYFMDIFGKDDFYLELQPGDEEQQMINSYLAKISKVIGIKTIITSDSHYVEKEDKEVHEIYLKAGNPDRDVSSFYGYNYIMSADEISSFFEDKELVENSFKNSNDIMDNIEEYSLNNGAIMPSPHIPGFKDVVLEDFDATIDWSKYRSIIYYSKSNEVSNRYYLKLIFDGIINRNQPVNDITLSRIDTELKVVKDISDYFEQPLSNYFLADREFVNIIWKHSLLGIGRGSASSFYTNYLLDIVQINALDENYNLPYFRFANSARVDSMFDIDLDAQGTKREDIIEDVKEQFGRDKVINIGTYLTEGARSTVLTVTRGLGLSVSEGNNILDLLPNEKGVTWDVKDAIYGNAKKGRKPSDAFINEIKKYPLMERALLKIQGVVSGIGQHASGVSVTNDSYTNHFPAMKTTNGLVVSQWDAHELEEVGVIKFDFLSISALDRINEAIKLLVDDGYIEWQGNLKDTYNKYFNLDDIDVNDSKLYDALNAGDVWKVFQFSSSVALQGIDKVKPKNFMELATTNSLIRLTTDGEQLIDKYIRFKNDISQWYQEMNENGLSQSEQLVLRKHLDATYGIMDSQEKLMRISMDKDISNFDMAGANRLRKSVAKKDPVLQEKEHIEFLEKAKENGTSDNLARYVWDFLFAPTLSYAFSEPHTYAYTGIGVVEMYIAAYFPSIYWKTASISVDAGTFGGEFNSIDYTSVASAVSSAKNMVQLPDINRSNVSFTPDKTIILFGLGGISGLGLADINAIIDNRPYNSFDNFMEKVGKDISTKKIITLIKAGVFHEFDPSTRSVAIYYLSKYTERKTKLTTVQLPKIINDIPDEFATARDLYIFKNALYGRNAVKMSKELEDEFFDKWEQYGIEYEYVNGVLVVDKKTLDKVFNNEAKELKEWLKTDDAIELLARMDMRATWIKEMTGNEASWYFSTLSYYPYKHQLATTGIIEDLNIKTFSELPVDGKYVGKRKQYEKVAIAGTVISKNIKGVIDIITTNDEVVSVRVGKDRYGKYNKKIISGSAKERVLESDSFFNRGETLLFIGYRRMNDFIANNYGTNFEHPVMRIKGYSNYTLEAR